MFVCYLTDRLEMKFLRPPGWDSALFLPAPPRLPIFPSKLWSRLGEPCPTKTESHPLGWAAGLTSSLPLSPGVAEVRLSQAHPPIPWCPGHLPFLPHRSWASTLLQGWERLRIADRVPRNRLGDKGLMCRMFMPGWEGALGINTRERKGRKQDWAEREVGL